MRLRRRISPNFKKKLLRWAILILLVATLFSAIKAAWENRRKSDLDENSLLTIVRTELSRQMSITMMPMLSFLDDRDATIGVTAYLEQALTRQMPIYYYSEQIFKEAPDVEDTWTRDLLIRQEGRDEELKNISEGELDYDDDALHYNGNATTPENIPSDDDRPAFDDTSPSTGESTPSSDSDTQVTGGNGANAHDPSAGDPDHSPSNDAADNTTMYRETDRLEALLAENQLHADRQAGIGDDTAGTNRPGSNWINPVPFVVPDYPAYTYDWSEGFGYDDLISNFYAVDAMTAISEDRINLDNLLRRDLTLLTTGDQPQILIYHTHSQEGFADSTPGDRSTTIVGAGERLANLLRDQYGFNVLHHTGEYDVESRDYAYSNSLPAIEQLLADHPSIEVVIDLHRDEMSEGNRLVMDLQGRPTARFMFFNGISYTRQTGAIDYLENNNLDVNLAFSFQSQVVANEYYPGLARKIYLRAYRYNMHLMPRYTLVELGAQNNTVEEIMNACDPLAHIIATVLTDRS